MLDVIMEMMPAGIIQGWILALVAFGIMIPFRLLDRADLTAEGAYPLGGALAATLLVNNISPFTSTAVTCLLGGLAGVITALIHLRLKVNSLLAGIIVSTMMYSINLRLLGKPNVALFDYSTLFTALNGQEFVKSLCLGIGMCSIGGVFYKYLHTEKGLRFRAVGMNPAFAERQGIMPLGYILLGFFISSSLSTLAGALMVQLQSYADVGMGVGMVIHGLAALMVGEALIGTATLKRQLIAPILGALLYQQIQGIVLSVGLAPSDLKFFTAVIVLLAIGSQRLGKKV